MITNYGKAIILLEYALHLRMYGECAPGGTETWAEFDRRCEDFLRHIGVDARQTTVPGPPLVTPPRWSGKRGEPT